MPTLLFVVASPVRSGAVRGALATQGWSVIDAADGAAALRSLAASASSAVLVDSATVDVERVCGQLSAADISLPVFVLGRAEGATLPPTCVGYLDPVSPPSELAGMLAKGVQEQEASQRSSSSEPEAPPTVEGERQWTSKELFGDLLDTAEELGEETLSAPQEKPELEPAGDEEATAPLPSLGSYELLERVAVGGMAEVWRAERRGVEGFRKTVAIKKIRREFTRNREFVDMFIREAMVAAELHHDNIVEIYDLGRIDDEYCIAMEFIDGQDLRTLMNAARRAGIKVPLPIALLVCARVTSALAYAHGRRAIGLDGEGVVHCDVSPRNVLISREGHVKLCDFGIAKAERFADEEQRKGRQGKVQYMSPEQARGAEIDSRSDLFSFGIMLYELLVGRRPFVETRDTSLLDALQACEFDLPRSIDPAIPPAVEEIVRRCLGRTPGERYAGAVGLQTALSMVLGDFDSRPVQSDLVRWAAVVGDAARDLKTGAANYDVLPQAAEDPAASNKAATMDAESEAEVVLDDVEMPSDVISPYEGADSEQQTDAGVVRRWLRRLGGS